MSLAPPAVISGNYTPATPTAPAGIGSAFTPGTPTAPAGIGSAYTPGTPTAPAAVTGAFLQLSSRPLNAIEGVPAGVPHYIRILGNLTDGENTIVFPLMEFAYAEDGMSSYVGGEASAISFGNLVGLGERYFLDYEGFEAVYRSESYDIYAHLATGFVAQSPFTGVPRLEAVNFTPGQVGDRALVGNDLWVCVAPNTWDLSTSYPAAPVIIS